MASKGKKGKKYSADAKVDEWLLNQIVKYFNHDKIGSFARDLEVEESVYSSVTKDDDKTFKVNLKRNTRKTGKDLWGPLVDLRGGGGGGVSHMVRSHPRRRVQVRIPLPGDFPRTDPMATVILHRKFTLDQNRDRYPSLIGYCSHFWDRCPVRRGGLRVCGPVPGRGLRVCE